MHMHIEYKQNFPKYIFILKMEMETETTQM